MDHQDELGRLAGIIEKVLARFDGLKKEKKLLEETVQQKEAEAQQLRQEVSLLNEEKQHICKRVDSLLVTIEKWEEENVMADNEAKSSEHNKSASQLAGSSSQLFSLAG
jgi:predicted nuclease with TOPRIM domain